MLFYLDKELAKEGIAKCIAVSEIDITQEELEARKKFFNVKEVLVFEGIDIPHKFKYNKELDTIEEVIEIVEDTSQTLSAEIEEFESEFDESVEIEPEIFYFYISKEYADTRFIAKNIATFDQPVKYPEKFFTEETYMVRGKSVPYYITVQNNVVREATEYEKYTRGQRKLSENEVVLKEEIVALEDGQYLDEEKQEIITVPCPPEYLKNSWDKENHIWEDLTTDYDRFEKTYREYNPLDTYSVVTEMRQQDEQLAIEFVQLLINLRKNMNNLRNGIQTLEDVSQISDELQEFKNKYKFLGGSI